MIITDITVISLNQLSVIIKFRKIGPLALALKHRWLKFKQNFGGLVSPV